MKLFEKDYGKLKLGDKYLAEYDTTSRQNKLVCTMSVAGKMASFKCESQGLRAKLYECVVVAFTSYPFSPHHRRF